MFKKKKNRILEDEIKIEEVTNKTDMEDIEIVKEETIVELDDEVVIRESMIEDDEIIPRAEPLINDETIYDVIEPETIIDEPIVLKEEKSVVDENSFDSDLIPREEIIKEDNKELDKYFDDSRKENAKNAKKKPKKAKVKKESKRLLKQRKAFEDVKNQRVYKFRKKKYTKVDDFIKFLNDNYLDIDNIAKEVLDDKAFYGFISKKSGVFETSIKEFKKIKEEIDR
ncbi:MAG: hypothetical protein QM489_01360 [Candidatus Izemoplasma sp.]